MDGCNAFEWSVWNQFLLFECVVSLLLLVGTFFPRLSCTTLCDVSLVNATNTTTIRIQLHTASTHTKIRIHFYGLKVKSSAKNCLQLSSVPTVSEANEILLFVYLHVQRCLNPRVEQMQIFLCDRIQLLMTRRRTHVSIPKRCHSAMPYTHHFPERCTAMQRDRIGFGIVFFSIHWPHWNVTIFLLAKVPADYYWTTWLRCPI